MWRDRGRSLLAGVLLAVAFGGVAATVDPRDRSSGPPPEPREPAATPLELPAPVEPSTGRSCPAVLADPGGFALVVAGTVAVAAALAWWRDSPALGVAAGGPVLTLAVALCPPPVVVDLGTGLAALPPVGVAIEAAPPAPLLVSGFLLALVGGAALLFVVEDDRDPLDSDTADTDEAGDLERVGRAAGDAADRIEHGSAGTNPVYRAWTEMVAHLDVADPETATPGEFADAATAAGMDPDDVAELTELFEAVRYGDRDPEARAERALATLRRIEAAYADGGDED
ncbi:DUF4129 domain-containing protein [Halosimplex halophilum]|uniref:DUF4129 domain-containing protein n=1 Tax=Halosimplex halophilum TaxID=2559572 RepID=UPI001AE7AD0C|nr:DUF4129 domain-containing protein [Halosimplex halophilum]